MPEAQPLRPHDPRRLGSYELTGRLGAGGQGTVFLGAAPDGAPVAVKLLRVQFDDDDTARSRFVREAAAARQVARFCTAQILDADVAGDSPYLVSEYVPGPALSRQVSREGPISGGALDRLAVSTASALTAIHRAGIVHRDLKPHNVLLGPDGPRVIDFGLSRALDAASAVTSRAVGTPAYMAPEQVAGGDVAEPSDVFAWGATMTYAATGRPPFGADSIPAVIYRVLHHEPELGDPADGLDGELRGLVEAALSKDPAHRPTAAQLLLRLVGHEEAFAPASPGPVPPGPGPVAPNAHADGAGAPGLDTLPPAATQPGAGHSDAADAADAAPPAEVTTDDVPPPGPGPGPRRRHGKGLAVGVAAAVVAALAGAGGAYAMLG
ncbi:serine/threonine-protein kinase, partial [Actinomadura yumaensis]